MVYITRKEHFNAAHKLWRPDWTEEKNHDVFGKCANPNWHGHNYTLLVTVKGNVNPETGYLVDLKDLSRIIKEEILDALDHKNLNLDVPFMYGKMASTEVLTVEIWNRLIGPLKPLPCTLHSIQLFETENNSVTYYGE
jgi:6-pyruvoyltetrahydropterin/6-carboxytetrahydropterin synthase